MTFVGFPQMARFRLLADRLKNDTLLLLAIADWYRNWPEWLFCPEKYVSAVAALCEKFSIPLPKEYLKFKQLNQ
jgi:hypothetical protein